MGRRPGAPEYFSRTRSAAGSVASLRTLLALFLLCGLSGVRHAACDAEVWLDSLAIYSRKELFFERGPPHVYFQCRGGGEPRKDLSDVTHTRHVYNFSGHESFQPLTTLSGAKCKRCGLYEHDSWKPDDVYDEWELCPLDFAPPPDGRLSRSKRKAFDATFSCSRCHPPAAPPEPEPEPSSTPPAGPAAAPGVGVQKGGRTEGGDAAWHPRVPWLWGVLIAVWVMLAVALGALVRLWVQRRLWPFRRSKWEDTARFMQLFDEDDELDEELGDTRL